MQFVIGAGCRPGEYYIRISIRVSTHILLGILPVKSFADCTKQEQ